MGCLGALVIPLIVGITLVEGVKLIYPQVIAFVLMMIFAIKSKENKAILYTIIIHALLIGAYFLAIADEDYCHDVNGLCGLYSLDNYFWSGIICIIIILLLTRYFFFILDSTKKKNTVTEKVIYKQKYCKQCGVSNNLENKYCRKCGNKFED